MVNLHCCKAPRIYDGKTVSENFQVTKLLEIKLICFVVFLIGWTIYSVVNGKDWFDVFTYNSYPWSRGVGFPAFCFFLFFVAMLCHSFNSSASVHYPSYEESYPIKTAGRSSSKPAKVSKTHKMVAESKKAKPKHASHSAPD